MINYLGDKKQVAEENDVDMDELEKAIQMSLNLSNFDNYRK